jgi:hypothetical protein
MEEVKKSADQVTITCKGSQAEKSDLINKAMKVGLTQNEYVRHLLFDEKPENIQIISDSTEPEKRTDEEREADATLIKNLRSDLATANNKVAKLESMVVDKLDIQGAEKVKDFETKIAELMTQLESFENSPGEAILNEDFVQEFLDWAESDKGRKELQGGEMWFDSDIDITGLNRSVLLAAAMEMAICYIMPGKRSKSFEACLKERLELERAHATIDK